MDIPKGRYSATVNTNLSNVNVTFTVDDLIIGTALSDPLGLAKLQ
ncbi:hypothetical protein [uncultured Methanobrevibacter sp.]|nr:hypothetical protein [uncultured Methanobrevibacter sp.]